MAVSSGDIIRLRNEFEIVLKNRDALERLIVGFCESFLVDSKGRPLKLRPMQINIVAECLTNRYLMLLAPRGSGKSKALGVAITMWLYFFQAGEKVAIVAPQMKQCKIIFSDVVDNFNNSPILSELDIINNIRLENDPILKLKGGSQAIPLPAETKREGQSIRGFHATFCVVDESPMIPDNLFEQNIEPIVLAEEAPFINIGTPKSKDNHCYRYLFDERYSHFRSLKYTYIDAMNKGDAYKTPYSEEDIEIKKRTWGEDSIQFRTEYLCEFIEQTGQFFTSDDFERSMYELDYFVRDPKEINGDTFVTVDLAQSHNSIVYALWEAAKDKNNKHQLYLRDIHEIQPPATGIDPKAVRTTLIDYCKYFNCRAIVLDSTGSGKSMFADFKREAAQEHDLNIRVIGFNFSINKAEDYSMYKNHLRLGEIKLPRPDSLKKAFERKLMTKCIEQHLTISYEFAKDLKNMLVKAKSHRHDDFPDCLCMSTRIMGKASNTPVVLGVTREKQPKIVRKSYEFNRIDEEYERQKYGGGVS